MGILGWLRGREQEREEEPRPQVAEEDVKAAEERLCQARELGRQVHRVAAESERLRAQNSFSERVRAATGKVANG